MSPLFIPFGSQVHESPQLYRYPLGPIVGAYSYLTATKQEHQQQPTLKLPSFSFSYLFLHLFLLSVYSLSTLCLSPLGSTFNSSNFLPFSSFDHCLFSSPSFPFRYPPPTFLLLISFSYSFERLSFLFTLSSFLLLLLPLCAADLSVKPAKIVSAVLNITPPVKYVTYTVLLVLSFCQVAVLWEKKGQSNFTTVRLL